MNGREPGEYTSFYYNADAVPGTVYYLYHYVPDGTGTIDFLFGWYRARSHADWSIDFTAAE